MFFWMTFLHCTAASYAGTQTRQGTVGGGLAHLRPAAVAAATRNTWQAPDCATTTGDHETRALSGRRLGDVGEGGETDRHGRAHIGGGRAKH